MRRTCKVRIPTLRIKELQLSNPLALAPMAGLTVSPFRFLAKKFGCSLVYTEMISAHGIVNNNHRSYKLICSTQEERLIAIQLFSYDPHIIGEAAQIVSSWADIIDINMGCPTRKIVKSGSGAALMRDPKRAGRMIRMAVRNSDCPVTVKLRLGWNEKEINVLKIAKIAESEGAAAVAIHGRTARQFYEGKANWEIIAKVREKINIPVFANGDVTEPAHALKLMRSFGVDGVLIGRGALGNPWIFSRTLSFLMGAQTEPPTLEERFQVMEDLIKKASELQEEWEALNTLKRHLPYFIKGLPYSHLLRSQVVAAASVEEVEEFLYIYQSNFIAV